MRLQPKPDTQPVVDRAGILLDQIEREVESRFAPGSEPRAALEYLIASLRDAAAGGESDDDPSELLDCLEDILEAHTIYERSTTDD